MNLPRISISRPPFSPRLFIYFLFGLIILVLVAEGGYYFWLQRRVKEKSLPPPSVLRQEDIFTYVKGVEVEKQIWGVVEEINGDELTIRASNGEEVKIKYNRKDIWIEEKGVGFMRSRLEQLRLGDRIELSDIKVDSKSNFSGGFLLVVR